MYSYKFDKRVAKFLEKREINFLKLFENKIEKICINPYDKSLDIQKYTANWDNHFRFRLGKYRFLYYIMNDELVIYFYDADSRGDIYK